MYTFKYEDDNVSIEVKPKEHIVELGELLKTFEDFLRATGFNWISSIEHVQTLKEEPTAQSSQMQMVFQPMSARGIGPE